MEMAIWKLAASLGCERNSLSDDKKKTLGAKKKYYLPPTLFSLVVNLGKTKVLNIVFLIFDLVIEFHRLLAS